MNSFISKGDSEPIFIDEYSIKIQEIHDLMERYESWDWNFGSSPEFNVQINERFPWGGVDLYLLVNDGIIAEANINTDALDINLPRKIKDKI